VDSAAGVTAEECVGKGRRRDEGVGEKEGHTHGQVL
jgi:hypothetical protein